MKSTLWWLGLIFGTLSVVMLIKHGFDYGFVAPLRVMLEFYEGAMQALFGWAEPTIKGYLVALGVWFGLDLPLLPHWKHVFVTLWLYFGADARTVWAAGNRGTTLFYLVWGGLIALISGVGAGTITDKNVESNLMLAAFPIGGVIAFELGVSIWSATFFRRVYRRTWWHQFQRSLRVAAYYLIIGMVALAAVSQAGQYLQGVRGIGLALVLALAVAVALYWLWEGVRETWRGIEDQRRNERGSRYASDRSPGDESRKFWEQGNARFGLAMLSTLAGALAFVLINAGLKLAGL